MALVKVRKYRSTGAWIWECPLHYAGGVTYEWKQALAWATRHVDRRHRNMEQNEYSV